VEEAKQDKLIMMMPLSANRAVKNNQRRTDFGMSASPSSQPFKQKSQLINQVKIQGRPHKQRENDESAP
jgi:hypothetical protein